MLVAFAKDIDPQVDYPAGQHTMQPHTDRMVAVFTRALNQTPRSAPTAAAAAVATVTSMDTTTEGGDGKAAEAAAAAAAAAGGNEGGADVRYVLWE